MPIRALLLTALASLLLVGCGGDDAPSIDEFASDAEQLCDEGEKKLDEVERPQDVQAVTTFADDVEKVVTDTGDKMAALDKPDGDDGEKATQFVESFQSDIENQFVPKMDDIRNAAEGGSEQETVKALESIGDIETPRTDKLARDIGAEGCAE